MLEKENEAKQGTENVPLNNFFKNIKHFQVAFYKDCWYNIFVIKKVFYV